MSFSRTVLMMNFEGLDPGLGDYSSGLHGSLEPGLEPSLDPRMDPSLLQGVELDQDGLAVPGADSVHLLEGMFSELHSVAAEVGIPVTATHFDVQEELLWMGNHRVRDNFVQLAPCVIRPCCLRCVQSYS